MRLLVTGAAGLLGSALASRARARGHDVVAVTREDLDVTLPDKVRAVVRTAEPAWIAHCAAYTAVDRAEAEPDLAFAVNAQAAASMAEAARRVEAGILYPSSDFVFDGLSRSPYPPTASPAPICVYGMSKYQGERAVVDSGARYLVARTSWLYGAGGSNFVDMVVRRSRQGTPLRVVSDQRGRPTWTVSLAEALLALMESDSTGITHVADRGTASWYELAREVVRVAGLKADITPVTSVEWGAPAPRPAYSVLDLEDVEMRLGRAMPVWTDSLGHHLSGIQGQDRVPVADAGDGP